MLQISQRHEDELEDEEFELPLAYLKKDVFGIGAIYYFLLTGQAPFRGSSREETLQRAKLGAIPNPVNLAAISRAENRLRIRCLDPNLENRFATASEFLADVAEMKKNRRNVRIGWATTFILAAASVLGYLFYPKSNEGARVQARIQRKRYHRIYRE